LSSDESELAATLERLYASYAARAHRCHGLPDRRCRQPERLLALARALQVWPDPQRTVCLTGSKGKGTTARLTAWALQARGARVGLVVSPGEHSDRDRLRIDNVPIPASDLVRLFHSIEPALQAILADAPAWYYLSPAGVFLVLALLWFREQRVDYWVLEAGRGAAFDEVGQLHCAVAVVTAILDEHRDKLGPSLAQIAADKAAIGRYAQCLVVSEQARPLIEQVPEWARLQGRTRFVPLAANWEAHDRALAETALAALLGGEAGPMPEFSTPSRGEIWTQSGRICYQAGIDRTSLDALVQFGLEPAGTCLVLALSDDKAWRPLLALVERLAFDGVYCLLFESRYLRTQAIAAACEGRGIGPVSDEDDGAALRRVLDDLLTPGRAVLFIGVQIAVRQLRRAYRVPLAGPAGAGSGAITGSR
jgi:dihydrofolate synthase/folylpolyglutamate synthase